jgi:hypothetical protein
MANRADQRKFHYIYKITRTDGSGKFYIGMHSTDDLDDGYFGSGQLLWRSIAKHGKEKHSKEILEFLPTRAAVKLREREIVTPDLLEDVLCMNLCPGGEGGAIPQSTTAAARRKAVQTAKDRGVKWTWAGRKCEPQKNQWTTLTPAAREKRKATMAVNEHQQGTKNSNYGLTVYVNPETNKRERHATRPTGWLTPHEIQVESKRYKYHGTKHWYNDGIQSFFLNEADAAHLNRGRLSWLA